MLCWVLLGTFGAITLIYATIKLCQYIQEREDEDVMTQDDTQE